MADGPITRPEQVDDEPAVQAALPTSVAPTADQQAGIDYANALSGPATPDQSAGGAPGATPPVSAPGTGTSSSTSTSGTEHTVPAPTIGAENWQKLTPDDIMSGAANAMDAEARDVKAEQAANDQKAEATADYQTGLKASLDQMQRMQMDWAKQDEHDSAVAAQEASKYIAAYQEQLATVRQIAAGYKSPLADKWTAVGVSMGMFAQGFLAARGIHIDVAGQVDKWVDQSIQEQNMKIGAAKESAEGQLHLWEIARQTSKDDAEARQRYRGMFISGVQSQIQSQAAQYQSKLAAADANAANAKLQFEADKTNFDIWSASMKDVLALQNQYRMYKLEQQRLQVEEYKASLEASARKDAASAKSGEASAKAREEASKWTAIPDMRHEQLSPGGQAVAPVGWVIHKDNPMAKEVGEVNTNIRGALTTLAKADEERKQLAQKYSKFAGVPESLLNTLPGGSEALRDAEGLRNAVAEGLTKAITGNNRPNVQVWKSILDKQLPLDKLLTQGTNESVWQDTKNAVLDKEYAFLGNAQKVTPENARQAVNLLSPEFSSTGQSMVFHTEGAPNDGRPHRLEDQSPHIVATGGGIPTMPTDTEDFRRRTTEIAEKRETTAEQAGKAPTVQAVDTAEKHAETASWSREPAGTVWKAIMGSDDAPSGAAAVNNMFMAYAHPQVFRQAHQGANMPDSDKTLSDLGHAALRHFVNNKDDSINPEVQEFAKKLLNEQPTDKAESP